MRTALIAVLAAVALLATALPAAAQEGQVTVVHGIPDVPVDVYVDDQLALEGFQPGTITDPIALAAGDHTVEIFPAGADPAAEDPVISETVTVPADVNASAVAHLDEGGTPTLGVFVNDTSAIPAGQARLTVRHTAAAPAVDVRAGGQVVFSSLTNGNEATAVLPAGTVSADVVPAGTQDPVLGPADVTLTEGTSTIVYAIGSLEAGNLDLLVQSISGLGAAPGAMPAGSGGQAAGGFPLWVGLLMLAGAALAARGLLLARMRR